MKKLLTAFAVIALAVSASAATKYKVTLPRPSLVNGTELKAGDYKVEVTGDNAVFQDGKNTVETKVRVEELPAKVDTGSVRYGEGNKLIEIRTGRTKLVFAETPSSDSPTVAH